MTVSQTPIFSDAIDLGQISNVATTTANSPKVRLQSDFWSTPERPVGDPTREILETTYSTPHSINYLTFEVAHFPHTVSVEYYDESAQVWTEVLDRAGNPITQSVGDSRPSKILPFTTGVANQHPQHHGADHWLTLSWRTQRFTAQRLRLVLVRTGGQAPVDIRTGVGIPYSLGVRRLDFGYRITARSDVPGGSFLLQEEKTIASTVDYLGSRVDYSTRSYPPSNATSATGSWRSAPQPLPYAVVNYFLDTRSALGDPQTVDRFMLDPLTPGPHMTIYYSNDTPTDFISQDSPILHPVLTYAGTPSVSTSTPEHEWLDMTGSADSITIDNASIQWDKTRDWWTGLTVQPQFGLGDPAAADHPLVTVGDTVIRAVAGKLQAVLADGTVLSYTIPSSTPTNPTLSIVFGYLTQSTADFSAGWVFGYQIGEEDAVVETYDGTTATGTMTLASTGLPVDEHAIVFGRYGIGTTYGSGAYGDGTYGFESGTIYGSGLYGEGTYGFGVDTGGTDGNSASRYRAFVLKQESLLSDDLDLYFADPTTMTLHPDDGGVDHTLNALIRFWPQSIDLDASPPFFGFVGGRGVPFEELVWTPIARDFLLKAGEAHIPPTRAKFFKFEFTNLVPEQYEVFVPITAMAKFFPPQIVTASQRPSTWAPQNAGPGWSSLTDLNPINRYYDALGLLAAYEESAIDSSSYSPTALLVATNAQTSKQIGDLGWIWDFDPWQVGVDAPRFDLPSQHVYDEILITRVTKTAYFVGLHSVKAGRVSHAVAHDRARYFEPFHEAGVYADNPASMVESVDGGFTLDGSSLSVPDGTGPAVSTARSRVIPSVTPIRGLQYATHQSGAYQLLPDPYLLDFADNWQIYGDASVTPSAFGGALVERGFVFRTYGGVESVGTYGAVEALGTYANVEGEVVAGGLEAGGIQSNLLTPTSAGRAYAVVRVSTVDGLAIPLTVEVLDDGDNLVASQTYTPGKGETTSIVVPFSIPVTRIISGGVSGGPPPAIFDIPRAMRLRIYQDGESSDSFTVIAASIFEDGLVWEFSNDGGATFIAAPDIRNDPNGAVLFPELGTELVWRVTGNREGVKVTGLAIRPWYIGDAAGGVTPKHGVAQGPNRNIVDDYGPISSDPMWQQWHHAVPRWWYQQSGVVPT